MSAGHTRLRVWLLAVVFASSCTGRVPSVCTQCSGVCVDINVDSSNCGSCGAACVGGSVCSGGHCVASCPTAQTACDGGCFDLQVDPRSCGVCGRACASGFCQSGTCQTPGCSLPRLDCSGACVDPKSDPANCGACGRGCDGGYCVAGDCRSTCPAPLTACGASCTDTSNDPQSCGVCGRGCDGGYCVGGACRSTCAAPLTQCGNRCADTTVDPQNCGACGRACTGATCSGSVCSTQCLPGWVDCDGIAANGCESREGCLVPITVGLSGQLINDPALVPLQLGGGFASGPLRTADLSADGQVIAFVSASSAVTSGDVNGFPDVFMRELATGITKNLTFAGNAASFFVAVSGDGRFIAFVTDASNVGGVIDTNGRSDVYVFDRLLGSFEKVTQAADGGPTNDGDIDGVDLSYDGRFVVFGTAATNLVDPPATAGGPGLAHKLYRVDRLTHRATLLTQAPAASGPCFSYDYFYPRTDDDGLGVTFATPVRAAAADQNEVFDQYVLLADAGFVAASVQTDGGLATTPTCGIAGNAGDLSGDGRTVVFHGFEDLTGAGDTSNDVFARDVVTGRTQLVSVRPDGGTAAGESAFATVDRTASRIAYVTSSMFVTTPPLPTSESHCVLAERVGGVLVRNSPVAVGLPGEYPTCFAARVSGNGRAILFGTTAPLSLLDAPAPSDGGGMDLYLRYVP